MKNHELITTASGFIAAEGTTIIETSNVIGGHIGYRLARQIVCAPGQVTGAEMEIDHEVDDRCPIHRRKKNLVFWAIRNGYNITGKDDLVDYHHPVPAA